MTRFRWTAHPRLVKLRRPLYRSRFLSCLDKGKCTVVLEKGAAEGVDVRIWVFDLADGSQDSGDGVEAFSGQIADVVVFDVAVGKALEMHESGISVSQHSMSVSRNDSAFLESLSHVLLDDLLIGLFSLVEVLELGQPLQAFLVGKAVQWSSKAVHGSGEGKIRISKCRSDEVAGVCRDISSLMIRVNGKISSNALLHLMLVEPKHVREVASPIESVIRSDEVATVVLVPVDSGADVRQLGKQIHRILEIMLPVLSLVGSRLISLEELAVDLQVEHRHGEHGHWMEILGKVGDEMQVVLAEISSVSPLARKRVKFLLSRVPSGRQQEEHGFWEWFNSIGSLLSLLAELRDRVSSEGDAADGIERGSIVEHNWQSTHSENRIVNLDLADNPIAMHFPEGGQLYDHLSLTFLADRNHLLLQDVTQTSSSVREISSDDELHINNYLSIKMEQ